jgi:hypothetical protein
MIIQLLRQQFYAELNANSPAWIKEMYVCFIESFMLVLEIFWKVEANRIGLKARYLAVAALFE